MFTTTTVQEGEQLRIELRGEFDIAGVDQFEQVVERLDLSVIERVQLDFQEILLIDSTGIGSLLNFASTMTDKGTTVEIININEDIRDIFSIIGVSDLLQVV